MRKDTYIKYVTCVQHNCDYFLFCQFGFDRQRLLQQLVNGRDAPSVAHIWTFLFQPILVTHHIQPFPFRLSSYLVVAGREGESAAIARCMFRAHRLFEVEIWGAWPTRVTKARGSTLVTNAPSRSPMRSSRPLKKSSMEPPAPLYVENFLLVGSLSASSSSRLLASVAVFTELCIILSRCLIDSKLASAAANRSAVCNFAKRFTWSSPPDR